MVRNVTALSFVLSRLKIPLCSEFLIYDSLCLWKDQNKNQNFVLLHFLFPIRFMYNLTMGVLPMYFCLPTTHPVSGWSSEEKEDTKAQFCYFCCRPFNILFLKKNSHDSS
jgi:hypothetical protein